MLNIFGESQKVLSYRPLSESFRIEICIIVNWPVEVKPRIFKLRGKHRPRVLWGAEEDIWAWTGAFCRRLEGRSLSGASYWYSSLNIIQWIKWRRVFWGGEEFMWHVQLRRKVQAEFWWRST